jgi:hypothetical protein
MLLEEGGFRVELLDEINDGTSLEIRARISAEKDWDTSQVAVRMTGLNRGDIKRERTTVLSDLLVPEQQGAVSDSEGRVVAMVLPADDITDYQFELLWGSEALALTDPKLSSTSDSNLELAGSPDPVDGGDQGVELAMTEDEEVVGLNNDTMLGNGDDQSSQDNQLQIERPIPVVLRSLKVAKRFRCPVSGSCKVAHGLEIALINEGSSIASDIELGVGYKAKSDVFATVNSAEEQALPLSGVALQPGEEQILNLELETELTEEQDQQLEPSVRVAAASY